MEGVFSGNLVLLFHSDCLPSIQVSAHDATNVISVSCVMQADRLRHSQRLSLVLMDFFSASLSTLFSVQFAFLGLLF